MSYKKTHPHHSCHEGQISFLFISAVKLGILGVRVAFTRESGRSPLGLNPWCYKDYFTEVLAMFLNIAVYGGSPKYLNMCSEDERRSYGFETTWGWVIIQVFIFINTTIVQNVPRRSCIRITLHLLFILHTFLPRSAELPKPVLDGDTPAPETPNNW